MSDDEFDDLFSFSSATIAPKTDAAPSSPINFDLSEQDLTSSAPSTSGAGTGSGTGVGTGGIGLNSTSAPSVQTSDTSSGSYYKVSPTITDPTPGLDATADKNDDGFGDFDLDAVKLKNTKGEVEGHQEDDFHAMDADTREFLNFLDTPGPNNSEVGKKDDDMMLGAELDLDDDSDDGMMDFVDINESSGSAAVKNAETSLDDAIEDFTVATAPINVVVSPTKTPGGDTALNLTSDEELTTGRSPSKGTKKILTPNKKDIAGSKATIAPIPPPLNANTESKTTSSTSKKMAAPVSASQYQSNAILAAMESTDSSGSLDEKNASDQMEETSKSDSAASVTGGVVSGKMITPEKKKIVFDTLSAAIHSKESCMDDIRPLLFPYPSNIANIEDEERPWLWSKAICSKTFSDVETSSLADSFTTWDDTFDMESLVSGENFYGLMEDFVQRLLDEVEVLSKRAVYSDSEASNEAILKRDLCSLLLFYYRSNSIAGQRDDGDAKTKEVLNEVEIGLDDSLVFEEEVTENLPMVETDEEKTNEVIAETTDETKDVERVENGEETKEVEKSASNEEIKTKLKGQYVEWNSLIGPVAATLLASGTGIAVASVMLSQIVPTSMPLITLTKTERMHAVKSLHQKLYYLICYHLPLLVLHLDRYVPGWYWPRSVANEVVDVSSGDDSNLSPTKKSRNLEAQGIIPITWFSSLLASEFSDKTLETGRLLALWDVLLTNNDQTLKFFLALSVLERNSDNLLMLKDQELINELTAVMSLERNDVEVESFMGDSSSMKEEISDAQKYVLTWCNHSRSLRETTPLSVVEYLQTAEDESLNYALNMRSKIAMEQMAARLEAEAEAHRQAVEEENARKLEERMHRYYKERLEKFYTRHCPDKIDSVDRILELYKDRYKLLDDKLHVKYGRGFLPMISVFNPKVTSQTGKLISNVNQGIEIKKKNIIAARAEERAKSLAERMGESRAKHQVTITVAAKEIMPVICGGNYSKASAALRDPLKYYLVDSRPDDTVKVQGSFPTAARLSPEDLMEPERIQEKVEMFESFRGAVHICIMGEGFSSFPSLYGHPLDKNEQKLLDTDESRTNMCALFFIKRGFPFVSVLDGGFAAAHAWLARDCDYLTPSDVLVDYDDETSLFVDLERSYQSQIEFSTASTRKKTTMAMQKLIDNSMVRLATAENQIEEFTDRFISSRKEARENAKKEDDESTANETKATDTEVSDNDDFATEPNVGLKGAIAGIKSIGTHHKENPKSGLESRAFDFSKLSFGKNMQDKKEGDSKTFLSKFSALGKASYDDDKTLDQTKFEFGKMALRRGARNPFGKKNRKLSKEDAELEKEIEASLSPPEPPKSGDEKKTNLFQNMKLGRDKEGSSNEKKNFKDAFKGISFNKFKRVPKKPKESSALELREEEAVLFEDD